MRIVHLEAGRQIYGGARQVGYLIAGLARLGIDNVLLCSRGSAIAASVRGAEVVELPLHGDLDVAQLRRIARALRTLAPDLLHVHSRRGADLYGGWSARRAGVPAVLTRRVESAELVLCARLKFRAYARVIAISTAIREELIGRFGLDPATVALVPSAVDAEVYRPRADRGQLAQRFDLPSNSLVLGIVAQLVPRKGYPTLLRAFARLAATDSRLYLICFGRGPLAADLERQVAAFGLTGRVRFSGFRDDLPELLPEVDVLVHPAEREGLGVAVLEALAAGVPVVAARAGGITDVIEDGVTGLLAPPGDDGAFAAAIARVLADAGLRETLIERGRRKVLADFSVSRMARGNLEIYEEVIGGHGSNG
jgi:glycosyltransferase involved in cell wall biosynthesis